MKNDATVKNERFFLIYRLENSEEFECRHVDAENLAKAKRKLHHIGDEVAEVINATTWTIKDVADFLGSKEEVSNV